MVILTNRANTSYLATLRNKIVFIMLLAGLAPAVVAYFSRILLEGVTKSPVVDGVFYLFTVSLMVLVSATFAGVISKKVLEKAQRIRNAADDMEVEGLLADVRKQAEMNAPTAQSGELDRKSLLLGGLAEAAPDGILMLCHENGRVDLMNSRFRELIGIEGQSVGYSHLKTAMMGAFEEGEEFEAIWKTRGGDIEADKEWQLTGNEGENWVRISTRSVNLASGEELHIWFFRDVTEARNLRSALHRSQRMESIGRLAGGIAHDFNNMLTGIIGNLSLAELSGSGERMSVTDLELVASARKAGQRAADLVKRLLDYSRDGAVKVQSVDVNELITDTHELLRNSFDGNIDFSVNISDDLWMVKADVTQLQQVLLNLCMNARDALEKGGEIHLKSANVSVDASETKLTGLPEGDFVCLSVEDTGVGIPPEMISKIFNPYFTTKKPSAKSGTGIGLAVTGEIVRKYDGRIFCESVVGKGTSFRVYLPRGEGEVETVKVVEKVEKKTLTNSGTKSQPLGRAESHNGSETVLLVDDEEMVRKVGEGILRKKGYNVILAVDGDEAVKIFDKEKGNIHLVLLDLTMPKLSGRAAFEMIKERSLSVPVLLCSGYPVELDEFEEETGYRPEGAVQKPFSVESLCGQIREVLDAHNGLVLSVSE